MTFTFASTQVTTRFVALLLLLVLGGWAPAFAAPLEDPAPISVPSGLTPPQVVTAIKRAAIGRGFTIESEAPGSIVARYAPRKHIARVTIAYTATDVRITYLDSSNLDYEDNGGGGMREIHRNYNRWVNNLALDISKFLSAGNF